MCHKGLKAFDKAKQQSIINDVKMGGLTPLLRLLYCPEESDDLIFNIPDWDK